ncbi:MAG: Mu transposase C-terminal domain-containing protein [Oscillospiraceae bacterium]
MKEIWITTKELAFILGIAQQNTRKQAMHRDYVTRYTNGRGRGGKVMEYLLSSLPAPVQERYSELHKISIPDDTTEISEYESKYTGKQKEKAAFRKGVVHKYWRSGKSAAAFVREFNKNSDVQISEWQLRDWEQRYKISGHSLESLIDRRGENRTGTETISPEAWQYFLELILTPQGRSVQACWEKVKEKYVDIPSVRTFERKYTDIPEIVKTKAEGKNDSFELQLPSLYRDYSGLSSNEIWCLDHHLSDVFVRNKRGKVVRLWMSCILDVRSRKVMSMVIRDAKPNKIAIKQGLRIAIEKYGLPKMIQTDNGKDYLSKDLDPNEEMSILSMLGIEKTTALPYHGQSKPVERFFETLENGFGKFCYGYAGNDAKNRPDYLRKLPDELAKDTNIQDMDDFISACNYWIDNVYAEKIHSGNAMNGRTPNEAYAQEMVEKRIFSNKTELAVICGERVKRVVRHDCIELFNRIYRAKDGALVNYIGKRVTVVFMPENIDVLYVFDEKFRQICTVIASVLTPFRTSTMEDYQEIKREQKKAKQIVAAQMPKTQLSVTDSLIQKQAEEQSYKNNLEVAENSVSEPEFRPAPSQRKKSSFALYNECMEAEKKKEVI